MRLRRAFAVIFAALGIFAVARPAYTGGGAEYVGYCECAITVESAHAADKVSAIENAMVKIKDGASPGETEYFSEKAIRRSLNDGYYTFESTGKEICLNVSVDGVDNDYEGVPVTAWEDTGDVTQRFRAVMRDDGSYDLFAACSRGGFSRVIGYDPDTGYAALHAPDNPRAASFFIKSGEGDEKYIVLSTDDTKYLAFPKDAENSTPAVVCEFGNPSYYYGWSITVWGAEAATSGGERALYPGNVLAITQGPYDIYSHQTQNAIDMQVNEGDSITAPFTCRVAAINEESGNCVWVESTSEVLYADGTYGYMTCMFMHDNDISDLNVGEIILQGQPFYEMGTAGFALGEHCHISCYRGKYDPSMTIENDGDNAVNAWEALFLPAGITVKDDYGFPWVYAD